MRKIEDELMSSTEVIEWLQKHRTRLDEIFGFHPQRWQMALGELFEKYSSEEIVQIIDVYERKKKFRELEKELEQGKKTWNFENSNDVPVEWYFCCKAVNDYEMKVEHTDFFTEKEAIKWCEEKGKEDNVVASYSKVCRKKRWWTYKC